MGSFLEAEVLPVNHKKKVLFVAHGLAPESYGGVEVYTRNIFDELRKNERVEPFVLTRTNREKFEQFVYGDEQDPHLFYIHTSFMDAISLRGRECDEEFRSFISHLRPDIVHFQHFLHLSLSWFKVVQDILPDTKIILTLHEYLLLCAHNGQMVKTKQVPDDPKNGRLCSRRSFRDCEACFPNRSGIIFEERERYAKACLEPVDLFTAPSNFLRGMMIEKFGIPPDKILYSENGQAIFQVHEKKRPRAGRLTLGFLGQINQYKGLEVLLRAMESLEGLYDIHLKIYGLPTPGPETLRFSQTTQPELARFKQVEYCGAYERGQLAEIFEELDLLVVPSIWWENSPLVIQEAFIAKVPVICSGIGGMAEKVTDGVNGLHFCVNDSRDLAAKILFVYKNRERLDFFRQNIPPVKTISENALELENLYLSL